MAERRPPGFNVDLGFYDSEEVLSIPRKIRAAAVGVWTLCGAYSANKLSDGYVSAEALRDRGCTPAIRAALKATMPEPLWIDAHSGGIQFTRWDKWQRTSSEIKSYRESEAERKREARARRKQASGEGHLSDTYGSRDAHLDATQSSDELHVPMDMDATSTPRDGNSGRMTSSDAETSGRTSGGRVQSVRSDSRDPKTETETKTETVIKDLAAQAPPAPKVERGKHLPENWRPNDGTTEWARSNCPGVDLRTEFEKFCNHWHAASGQSARKRDWDRAFKNWLMNAKPALRVVNGGSPMATSDLRVLQAQALKNQNPSNRLELE